MSDHRWQGYSHEELFTQINHGPGPDGSTDSVRRWSELTRALSEIDEELTRAVRTAMADWDGTAADHAKEGLRPLGEWAAQAQRAATTMRERAEQQAEFISQARRDMPPPLQITSEDPGTTKTLLTHLFGGQTDYEHQEAQQAAAEQHAYDVMRNYEASTHTNTTALASFTPPPQVVVDSDPGSTAGPTNGTTHNRAVTLGWTAPSPPAPPATSQQPGRSAGADRSARFGATQRAFESAANGRNNAASVRSSPSGTADSAERPHDRSPNPAASSRSGSTARHVEDQDGVRSTPETSSTPESSDEQVESRVTERVGDDGFFDVPQTTALPVIGEGTIS